MPHDDPNKDYGRGELHEREVDPDPIVQFGKWFEQAQAATHLSRRTL